MIHRAIILAAFGMLATSTLTTAQQSPLTVSEISPGLFVHTGVMELMMRRDIVWIGRVRPRTTARLRNISLPLRPERVADH
jgi:hypothetical protein